MLDSNEQQAFRAAVALHQAGRLDEAAELYRRLAKRNPKNFHALHYLGTIEASLGNHARAKDYLSRSLSIRPPNIQFVQNYATILFQIEDYQAALEVAQNGLRLHAADVSLLYVSAISLYKLDRLEESIEQFDKVVSLAPNHLTALNERASVLAAMKKYEAALASLDKVLAVQPQYAEAHLNKGHVLGALKRYDDALASYAAALAIKSKLVEAWSGRGKALSALRRFDDALAAFENALAIHPDLVEARLGIGEVFIELKRYDEALAIYDQALKLSPAAAWLGRGHIFRELKRYDEASAAYDKALALKPDLAEAWLGRGNLLMELKRYEEASTAYDKALSFKSDLADAWLGRGNIFYELKLYGEALAAYDTALSHKSGLTGAWLGRGNVLARLKRHDEAAESYAALLKIDPQYPFAKGLGLHQKMLACDWRGSEHLIAEIDKDIIAGRLSAEPFGWQGVCNSPSSLQRCAELYNRAKFPTAAAAWRGAVDHDKIRIGYSSGEFREQATAYLIVGILEHHDKSRFEIYAIDNGWDDRSETRSRVSASVYEIVDISRFGDDAATAAIRERNIDILVNLNGYFGSHRTQLFAQRPAPIQVNYLGFPGTLGAPYIDYIIADRDVIPEYHKAYYSEKVVYLPNSYQANDREKKIGAPALGRPDYGLPQSGFVFCCFNNNYKIVPQMFDCWMRILSRVDDSVLWLLEDNPIAAINLKKEAAARHISPDRLVFAQRVPPAEHLARHRLADLFLDTLPYNAHTTASDALWAGLPLLTQIGESFAGRVAASLLHAIGLPELIVSTPQDYEAVAIELALSPTRLAAIKRRLAENRLTTPLFDTRLFTRHIEAAYVAMYERHRRGLPPDHIQVAP